ncbi:hypothetical protein MLD38_000302 [Melastoma candidum]|uniref:Uncharacterized protein n=1 Tax=Melastoma candidum TaxID=119954 RepID=A0ACB9S909_9MYRT|nr:hypothetical protein MLD38_000302 [Melastoma candidum]
MGSCVSAYRNSDAIPPSPIKPRPVHAHPHHDDHRQPPPAAADLLSSLPPTRSTRSFGSKEDAFFDSKPWLDSDCEDDFYSVRGDFTPSRGNTPVHHSFSVGSGAQFVKVPLKQGEGNAASNDEFSPGSQKKKLGQLFSNREGDGTFDNGVSEGKPVDVATTTIPGNLGSESVCSAEMTPNGDSKLEKEKLRSSLLCLPRLTYCGNFGVKK